MGGSITNILSLCMRKRVLGRGEEESTVVVARGTRESSQGHAGGGLVGGAAKSETTGHPTRSDREW